MESFSKYYAKIRVNDSDNSYKIDDVFGSTLSSLQINSFCSEFSAYLVSIHLGDMAGYIIRIIKYAMFFDDNHFIASSDEFYFYCEFEHQTEDAHTNYRLILKPSTGNVSILTISIIPLQFVDERQLY